MRLQKQHMWSRHHCPVIKITMTANKLFSSRTPSLSCRHIRGRYNGGRRPSSDDSLHSSTVIPPSALGKPSIMKRYHRRWTMRWGVTARSPTMVTLHDTRFVECRCCNDGWTMKTVVTWQSWASMIPAPGQQVPKPVHSHIASCSPPPPPLPPPPRTVSS